ncbi:MAG: general secretion pathway protein GspK [Deltaproteobacteria bacterium]|nr:general secretion pathway protein GspK [Deltaproteobacteria bacterium]
MIHAPLGNRGIALILTILIVSMIVALTLQFNTSMRSNLHAASNLSDGIRLGCIARSGFNGALAALYADGSSGVVDTLRDDWAYIRAFSEASASLFEEGYFLVDVMDLSGRIQINRLVNEQGDYNDAQRNILLRLLSFPEFGLDAEEAENLVDAIKDWIDEDNEVTRFGAEDAYYMTLEKPYPCKNEHFEFPEELLLVRGMTRELFYGTEESPGISRYLSTYGEGKININTADPMVLRALSDRIDEELAEEMVAYRMDEDNDLSDPNWYKGIPGMGDISIPGDLITTASSHFEIISEGIKDTLRKRITGIVERKDDKLEILSWKVD